MELEAQLINTIQTRRNIPRIEAYEQAAAYIATLVEMIIETEGVPE